MNQNTLPGMRKAQEREMLPEVDLFPRVEYAGRKIDAAKFGPNTHNNNVASMQKRYFHSDDLPNVTFKQLSTAESLAVASYNFANLAKPNIFNPNWLQAGRILRAQEGVWINPLIDTAGNIIQDGKELEESLSKVKKVNEIYLFDGGTSFVPYGSFEQGVQEHGKFLESGLARGLIHTSDKNANTLSQIANDAEYPRGVNVWGFEPVKEPLVRVVSLGSGRNLDGGRLDVGGGWDGNSNSSSLGCAFGGLVSGEASTTQKIQDTH